MNKIFFDNQCHICISIKTIIEKVDVFNFFNWIENSNNIEKEYNYNFNVQLLDNTIVVISKSNLIYTEFYACRYILTRIPVFYPLLPFLYIPFLSSFFGNKLYRYISINRKCNNVK